MFSLSTLPKALSIQFQVMLPLFGPQRNTSFEFCPSLIEFDTTTLDHDGRVETCRLWSVFNRLNSTPLCAPTISSSVWLWFLLQRAWPLLKYMCDIILFSWHTRAKCKLIFSISSTKIGKQWNLHIQNVVSRSVSLCNISIFTYLHILTASPIKQHVDCFYKIWLKLTFWFIFLF